jgi:hypothetical protein
VCVFVCVFMCVFVCCVTDGVSCVFVLVCVLYESKGFV